MGSDNAESLDSEIPSLDATTEALDRLLQRETAAEKAVNYLVDELDQVKRLQHQAHIRPLLLSLVRLVDRLETQLDSENHEDLESFLIELQESLAQFEVLPMLDDSEKFNPSRQSAIRSEPTSDSSAHMNIIRRIRKGYTYQGLTLRPEEVIVAKYKAPAPAVEISQT